MPETTTTGQLREQVRERYAAAAITVTSGQGTASCCDDGCGDGRGVGRPEGDVGSLQ